MPHCWVATGAAALPEDAAAENSESLSNGVIRLALAPELPETSGGPNEAAGTRELVAAVLPAEAAITCVAIASAETVVKRVPVVASETMLNAINWTTKFTIHKSHFLQLHFFPSSLH